MIINVKTSRQGDEHNVFLEDFEGIVDGAGNPVTTSHTDNDDKHRHYHIGLADIIAHAPIIATYEELPESGIVAFVRHDGTLANIITYDKLGGNRLYRWMFKHHKTTTEHDRVHLLHVGGLALPQPTGTASTEEQGR